MTLPVSFHTFYDDKVRPYETYRIGDGWTTGPRLVTTENRELSYAFSLHAHPYVQELVKRLIAGSVDGLQAADTDYAKNPDGSLVPLTDSDGHAVTLADGTAVSRPTLYEELFTAAGYNPSALVSKPYPVNDLDFSSSGAYACYNWELFYHAPMTIAIYLSQNHRYEDAHRWFQYVFDPGDDSEGPTPARFWKVKPFQSTDVTLIEQILVNLSSGADPKLQNDTIASIGAWKSDPFRPFAVARYRPTAFMFKAVTACLDNLIAWGDDLFSQYTGETINEAAQLYILAANILGPKPQAVPRKGSTAPQTYASLRASLDAFGNTLVDLETDIPFDLVPPPGDGSGGAEMRALDSIGKALYFCVPRNDKLLRYWDTVADRLFKIRNSLNIQGVFQRVPLFEPPIDPALLARAAAAGLDVGAIISGLNQPLPLVRFQYLIQRASEVCQEVKSLGSNLLSAMEKHDNEAYSILRARHETTMLQLAEVIKYGACQEATKNREGIEQSITNTAARYTYYERLLGRQLTDIKMPSIDPLDEDGLDHFKLKASEPLVVARPLPVEIAQDVSGEGGGKQLNSQEVQELAKLKDAHDTQGHASVFDKIGAALGLIPTFGGNIEPFGVGLTMSFGGSNLASMMTLTASCYKTDAEQSTYEAGLATKVGGYARRELEWAYQSNTAAGEITQMFKQLRAAQIREAMAARDWSNHQQQIKQSQEVDVFLSDEVKGKTTNQAFYGWLKRELKSLYAQSFQFAVDVARKAERALQQELGDASLSFIQSGYMAGKEGLLAGEKLYQDVKRMELAYADLNRREYELTKHVSLLQLDPIALLQLRQTGSCTITIPEEAFDFDWPAYFRRLTSVAVSVPCVAGPYTSLSARLTLLKSSVRISTAAGPGSSPYPRSGADDPRFADAFGSAQSIVTSTGTNDSGLFETNLHDDRKLPFAWAGAISQWRLDIPNGVRQFDFSTIADVILHVRYTAREAGDAFQQMATANLTSCIENAQTNGSVRLFSLRHDFPTEWARFTSVAIGGAAPFAPITLTLRPEHYPFWSQGRLVAVRHVELFTDAATDVQICDLADGTGNKDTLVTAAAFGGLKTGSLTHIPKPSPTGEWTLCFNKNAMSDVFVAVTWAKTA